LQKDTAFYLNTTFYLSRPFISFAKELQFASLIAQLFLKKALTYEVLNAETLFNQFSSALAADASSAIEAFSAAIDLFGAYN
jgi:hypothetical protein